MVNIAWCTREWSELHAVIAWDRLFCPRLMQLHSSVLTYTIGSPEKRYSFVGIVLVIVNEVRLYNVLVLLMLVMDISCNAVI